jgi:Uma2 family endonuclease
MSTTSLMTFADFELLPDVDGEKRELVDGEVITMPPPQLDHTIIAKRILFALAAFLGQDRVWQDHTGYRIAGGWIEPDVSVSLPDQRRDEKYFIGSPMVAVEILSPREEIDRKLTLYFADGALEVWVIDPRHKTMTAYVKRGEDVIRRPVDREYHSDAAGITLSLAEMFR